MTYDEYDALPGLRSGHLKLLADESPAALKWHLDNKPDTSTASRTMLQANHASILEPETFEGRFQVYPGKTRSGKAFQAWKDSHPGITALTQTDMAKVLGMREAIENHDRASELMMGPGQSEVTLQWIDPETGLKCKARLDRLMLEDGCYLVPDLKAVGSVEMDAVARIAKRLGWLIQMAHYTDAVRYGLPFNGVIKPALVCVEDKPYHDVGVFPIEPMELEIGQRQRRGLMKVIADCKAARHWPGRYPEEEPFRLTKWDYSDGEASMTVEEID